MRRSFLQRIGDSNKLWLAVVAAVLLISFVAIVQAKRQATAKVEAVDSPPAHRPGVVYDDAEHARFVEDFRKDKSAADWVTAAHFAPADNAEDGDRLVVVVRPDTSADDIECISMMGALTNKARFKTRIKVVVYRSDAASGTNSLVATTKWVGEDYGFVTKFVPTAE
jgi:RecA/RadA recombinase